MHNKISYKNRWINIIFTKKDLYYPYIYVYFFATFNISSSSAFSVMHLLSIIRYATLIKFLYHRNILYISTRARWIDDARLKEAQNQWQLQRHVDRPSVFTFFQLLLSFTSRRDLTFKIEASSIVRSDEWSCCRLARISTKDMMDATAMGGSS